MRFRMRSAPRDPRPIPPPERAPRTSPASSGAPGDCRNSTRSKRSRARARSRNRRRRRNRTACRPSAWAGACEECRSRADRRGSRAASRGPFRPARRGCEAQAPWRARGRSRPRRKRGRSCARPGGERSLRRDLGLRRFLLRRLHGARHLRVVLAAPVGRLGDAEEIELDREAVGVLDEQLVELRLGEVARAAGDLELLQVLHQLVGFRGEESDVVDHAGIVPGRVLRAAEVVELRVRHAGLRHMHLDLAVDAQPIAWERKVRPRHHLESEHLAVEILGALEVVRANKIVVQFGDGHGVSPGVSRQRCGAGAPCLSATLCQRTKYTLRFPKNTGGETKVGKMIELSAADGHKLAAYRAEPKGKPRGGLIVVQEIFGVNGHIKSIADGYATDGYLAVAPAFFDRVERGSDIGYKPPDIVRGRAFIPKMQWDKVMLDAGAALASIKSSGKIGIVGYCWGR